MAYCRIGEDDNCDVYAYPNSDGETIVVHYPETESNNYGKVEFCSRRATLEFLEDLVEKGCHVPDHAFERLRWEIEKFGDVVANGRLSGDEAVAWTFGRVIGDAEYGKTVLEILHEDMKSRKESDGEGKSQDDDGPITPEDLFGPAED